MKVYIKLYAGLANYMPDKKSDNLWAIDIEPNTTVYSLIKKLNLPLEKVKIIFLNNRHSNGDEVLKDKDRIGIFPLIAGG
ncbi:MAG: MoaD/ThiS family protein [Deltaproteobacteria bacterium]|nr:MoaD/ThiS family protein [Deltaproteobacteria bacterium]